MIKQRDAADLLIPVLWGDVEHAALSLPVSSRREFSETWGVVYKNIRESATISVKAVDSVTGLIVRGVNLSIGPLDGKRAVVAITNDYGVADIETRNFKPTYLIAENPSYEFIYEAIELIPGETKSIVLHMVFKAII